MLRPRLLFPIILTVALVAPSAFAQHKSKIKRLTPTVDGTTGLIQTPVADTLRAGEFSFSLDALYYHRDPGDLSYTDFPLSFALGVTDRIEFFTSWEIHRRVHATQIALNKIPPGGAPRPAATPAGTTAFFNDSPFIDVGFGSGTSRLTVGAKFNLTSERRGSPVGFAVVAKGRFHMDASDGRLTRGVSSGANDAGFDAVMSKDFGPGATVSVSSGVMVAGDPENIERQNEWNTGVGVSVPLGTPLVQFIGEVRTTAFFGNRTGKANPKAPLDAYLGFRAFPAKWIAISGGYLGNIGETLDESKWLIDSTGRNGFFAQVALQRKINRPPTITCNPTSTSVTEGQSVTISADAYDEDDDDLTLTWTAGSGRVTQQGNSAVFDSTGLADGRYSLKAEVSDGELVASCMSDITVSKKRSAPTISCQPGSVNVTIGQSRTLTANASDANGDTLRYSWTVNGQSVTNNSASFEFGTVGRDPGNYTVRVTVTDTDNMSANCEFIVNVTRRPNNCPTVSLSLDKTSIFAGDTVVASATSRDPDGDALTLSWEVDGQSRPGSGSTLRINSSGMAGGSHSVQVTATDDRGCPANDTKAFNVTEKSIIQMPLNNIGKAKLDEIALKMQQQPRLKAVITGYTDDRGSDQANERVGMRRANVAKDYLVSQHNISEDRIEVKSGGKANPVADNSTEAGRKANRRVEVELSIP